MTDEDMIVEKAKLMKRLEDISPMPDDATVTQKQLDQYHDIVEIIDLDFKRDVDFVAPILDSFGYGDGYGIYAPRSHYFCGLPDRDRVLSEITIRLRTGSDGSKMWSLYVLAEMHRAGQNAFPGEHDLIRSCLTDRDLVRGEVADCLGALGDRRSTDMLKLLLTDPCEQVKARAAYCLRGKTK